MHTQPYVIYFVVVVSTQSRRKYFMPLLYRVRLRCDCDTVYRMLFVFVSRHTFIYLYVCLYTLDSYQRKRRKEMLKKCRMSSSSQLYKNSFRKREDGLTETQQIRLREMLVCLKCSMFSLVSCSHDRLLFHQTFHFYKKRTCTLWLYSIHTIYNIARLHRPKCMKFTHNIILYFLGLLPFQNEFNFIKECE